MKKTILISGASGFLGKSLTDLLKKKYYLYLILNKKKIKIKDTRTIKKISFSGNENLIYKLKNIKIDYIIHAATFFTQEDQIKNIKKTVEANIILGTYLLEIAKIKKVKKFINFSTNWENFNGKIDNAKNFYSVSKLAFSKILEYYSNNNKITKYFSLYLSDTFGKRDIRNKLIPKIKKNLNNNKIIKVKSKDIYLNILNINDVIKAVQIILNKKIIPGKYSIINKKIIKLSAIVKKLNSYKFFPNIQYSLNKPAIKEKIYNYKKIKHWNVTKSNLDDIVDYIINK